METCNTCLSKGFAILPVAYSIVPITVTQDLPSWANDSRITEVPAGNGYHYALRVLRQGFLYLWYQQLEQWETYSVTSKGELLLQSSPAAAVSVAKKDCSRSIHNPVNLEFLCIKDPESCGDIWFAFSEHKWLPDTLEKYQSDSALRTQRMTKVATAQWSSGSQPSATMLTPEKLAGVLDYNPAFQRTQLPMGVDETISTLADKGKTLSYNREAVSSQSTSIPWPDEQVKSAEKTLAAMQARSPSEGSEKWSPMLLALPDAMGIATEKAGWYREPSVKLLKFGTEREREISATRNIDYVRSFLFANKDRELRKTHNVRSERRADMIKLEYERKKAIIYRNFGNDPAALNKEIIAWDKSYEWSLQGAAPIDADEILDSSRVSRNEPAFSQYIAEKQLFINENLQEEVKSTDKFYKNARATEWEKYTKNLNMEFYNNFQSLQKGISEYVKELGEERAKNLHKWLLSDVLINTLHDYSKHSVSDGLVFENTIALLLLGFNDSEYGDKQIERWVEQYSAVDETNLVWRALTLNLQDVQEDMEGLLQKIREDDGSEVNESTMDAVIVPVVHGMKNATKYYKSALSEAQKINGVNLTLQQKSDSLLVTIGNKLFKIEKIDSFANTISEKLIKAAMDLRARAEPDMALRALKSEIELGRGAGVDVEKLVRKGDLYENARVKTLLKNNKYNELISAKEEFESYKSMKNTLQVSRVSVLLVFFNVMDCAFAVKKLQKEKDVDYDVLAPVITSMFYAFSSIIEFGIKPLETLQSLQRNITLDKDNPFFKDVSLNRMKVFAGVFMGVAGAIDVVRSLQSAEKAWRNDEHFSALLGGSKVLVSTSAVLRGTGQLMEGVAGMMGREAILNGGKAMTALASKRIFTLLLTWQVALGLIVVEALYNYLKDNKLQIWCEKSWFGKSSWLVNDSGKGYRSAESEDEGLNEVFGIKEIILSEDS